MIIENMKDKSWQELLRASLGPQGYKPVMRRSIQTVVIYEAVRCCKPELPSLKPFQRKIAVHDMTKALADTLDFLTVEQKSQILWRTNASQEIMNENNLWFRRKVLVRELERINDTMKVYLEKTETQEEAMEEYLREQFQEATKQQTSPPPNWQYNHNHLLLSYRLYYLNGQLNPNFPDPNPPKTILVATKKPARMMKKNNKNNNRMAGLKAEPMAHAAVAGGGGDDDGEDEEDEMDGENDDDAMDEDHTTTDDCGVEEEDEEANTKPSPKKPAGKGGGKIAAGPLRRRKMLLDEVREHLDLLKEFEGAIPPEEIEERKRQLFYRLPLPPLDGSKRKKAKTENNP